MKLIGFKNILTSTLLQYIAYSIFLLGYFNSILFINEINPNFASSAILAAIHNVVIFIIPIIFSLVFINMSSRNKLKFSLQNLTQKKAFIKLFLRLLIVVGLVLAGILLQVITKGVYYPSKILDFLLNSNIYLFAAIFPVSFAVFEAIGNRNDF